MAVMLDPSSSRERRHVERQNFMAVILVGYGDGWVAASYPCLHSEVFLADRDAGCTR